jgi:hypothetical protein
MGSLRRTGTIALSLLLAGCCRGLDDPYPGAGAAVITVGSITGCLQPLAVDDTDVFVATFAGTTTAPASEISAIPRSGGARRLVFSTPPHTLVTALAADGAHLFALAEDSSATPPVSSLLRLPKAGGAPEVLATGPFTSELVLSADAVLVARRDAVVKVPKGGGPAVDLAPGQHQVSSVASDGTSVYFTTDNRFEVGAQDHGVKKVPLAGGPVTVLADMPVDLGGVAVDGGNVVFLTDAGHAHTPGRRAIHRVPATGGPAVDIGEREQDNDRLLALGGQVYWTEVRQIGKPFVGGVLKRPIASGPVTTAVQVPDHLIRSVVTDGKELFLLAVQYDNLAACQILRSPP